VSGYKKDERTPAMIPPTDKDLLISTPNQGKEVSFAPAIKDKGIILKRAAR